MQLKLAHVALSRPSHLLCVAVEFDKDCEFNSRIKEMEKKGWEIDRTLLTADHDL